MRFHSPLTRTHLASARVDDFLIAMDDLGFDDTMGPLAGGLSVDTRLTVPAGTPSDLVEDEGSGM